MKEKNLFSAYTEILKDFKPRAIRTVLTIACAGGLEGIAILTLIPILNSLVEGGAGEGPQLFEEILGRHTLSPQEMVLYTTGVFITLGVLASIMRCVADLSLLSLRTKVEQHIRTKMSHTLLRMSWPHYLTLRIGDVSKAIMTEGFQISLGCNAFLDGMGALITVFVFLLLSMLISVELTIFTLFFGAIGGLLYRTMSKRSRRHASKLSKIETSIGAQVNDIFSNLKFFRGAGKTAHAKNKSVEIFRTYSEAYFSAKKYGHFMRFFFECGAVLFVASFLLLNQFVIGRSLASVLVFLSLFYRLTPRLLRVQEAFFQARTFLSWYETWHERMTLATRHPEPPRENNRIATKAAIDFHSVSFTYPSAESPAVKEVTLSIDPGECVALVGMSGSGKSSFVDLVLGLLHPTSGNIAIDNSPLNSLNLDAWRKRIGLVFQESPLFFGTVLDNIAWTTDSPSREKAIHVAKLAHAWEFIQHLPKGLDTVIGEKGGKLSGGQRQRIAIARALYRDPLLLILDEATSSLDGESEAKIQDALTSLKGQFTILMVAHRFHTVQMADRIFVFDRGQVIEEGSWDTLAHMPGSTFQKMANLQGFS